MINSEANKMLFTKPELTVEDLTVALHQANLKLREANRRLVDSEKKRTELLANISHDLRSPITTLRGYVEYLLSYNLQDHEEVLFILNQMYKKFLSLDYLLNEMFMITSLDALAEMIILIPYQIKKCLVDFFISCEKDKKYAKRRLSLEIPEDFTYYVLLNVEMFERVLDNLFTNALKYSKENDEILMQATLRGREITIAITDTGIGIEEDMLTRIFEHTFMISDSRTPEDAKGCGLGLSIASSIMEKHKGRIWCESTLGKGSTFYLSLPIYEEEVKPPLKAI
ncbi:MAG: HAMP domain-containing histidine kinase [Clostridiales bacterium]|jgi:signal transduction histidine kinase|nr:HAMP domain-containing histidine kinase [Clostridiales bacterium]